jgi:hypothetical protein
MIIVVCSEGAGREVDLVNQVVSNLVDLRRIHELRAGPEQRAHGPLSHVDARIMPPSSDQAGDRGARSCLMCGRH